MELQFVGRGAAFNPKMKSTAACFQIENDFFLVDCGETVFEEIWEFPQLKVCQNIYVLITHMHGDHVGSLGTFISYCHTVLYRTITILHPLPAITRLLSLQGIQENNYWYRGIFPIYLNNLIIKAKEVKHVDDMRCFGFLLQNEEQVIYYSGDAVKIPDDIITDFLDGKIYRIYQDTSSKKSTTHCFIGDLERLIPMEKRNQVYCMHLDSDCETIFREKGFEVVQTMK